MGFYSLFVHIIVSRSKSKACATLKQHSIEQSNVPSIVKHRGL